MQIQTLFHDSHTIVHVTGRLDAAWTEHFLDVIRDLIRAGHHDVRVDATELEYLSSAGIRAILKIRREVELVNGSFGIIRASAFVHDTLRLSGLEALLLEDIITSVKKPEIIQPTVLASEINVTGISIESHPLSSQKPIDVCVHSGWKPWEILRPDSSVEIDFSRPQFGLGVGASGRNTDDARERFGDFIAAGGYVAWQTGDGTDKPDYLEQAEKFAPKLHAVQAIVGSGSFTNLLRFHPATKDVTLKLSDLFQKVFEATQTDVAVMVALAEVDGLVGATLAKSPAFIKETDKPGEFPDVREWLAFCGERVHHRSLALVVAFLSRDIQHPLTKCLTPLPSIPEIYAHAHAVVLSFSALPQGILELEAAVSAVFEDNAPLGLLHLIEDDRQDIGLGQSSFIQGACWCAPIQFSTENIKCH